MDELKIIFSDAEIGTLEKMDMTLALHQKMREVVELIYETSALQCWAHEPGDDGVSIAGMLREVYEQLQYID